MALGPLPHGHGSVLGLFRQVFVKTILILTLRLYKRLVSPLLPGGCRFHPSCSDYMKEAIEKHGAARGAWLGAIRLLRCQPFSHGGLDPVP